MQQKSTQETLLVSVASSSSLSSSSSVSSAAHTGSERREDVRRSSVTAIHVTRRSSSSSASSAVSSSGVTRMERSGLSSASSPQGSSPIRQGSSPTRKEFDKEDPSQPAASSPKKCVEDSTPALLADLLPSTHAFVIPTAADLLTGVPLPTSSAVQPSSDSPHLKIIELDNEDAKLDPNENANTDKSEVLPFNDNESTRGMLAKTPTINYSEHFFLAEMEHYHESSQKGYHKPPQHNTKLEEELAAYASTGCDWTVGTSIFAKKSQRDTEELLRSDLAAATVRHRRLEEEVRETRAQLSQRGLQATELTRQLDAHRQEHARQAATIISLRSRLQEAEDTVARLQVNLQRSELSVAALSRDNKRQSERITELEERLRIQLEEREGAEQRGELSQKRLGELVASLTSMLGIPRASSSNHLLTDTILQKLSNLLKEASSLRRDKAELEENLQQRVAVADGARQTVGRLVGQLDEERRNVVLLRDNIETLGKSEEELRTRLRTSEEEVVSLRERVHSTSSSYGRTLEDLHATEAKLQKARDECLVVEHRRQQAEVEWKGVLNTIASLLSTSSTGAHEGVMVEANPPDIVQALQTRVAVTRETYEASERLKHRVANLEDQVKVQTEMYEAATKRAHKTEEESRSLQARVRTLEADLNASEQAREDTSTQKDKNGRLLTRITAALGLEELSEDGQADPDLIVCRAQQLAKLEGDKLVDKTTTVYQLQRKVKSLREAVDRKELHLDMLRRKLMLNEETTKAAKHVEDEKEDLLGRYRRQSRALERATTEASELRLQVRDLRTQLSASSDYKSRAALLEEKVEELSAKVVELESNKGRHVRKVAQLKEQVRVAGEQVLEERRVSDATLDGLSHDMALSRQGLREALRRERTLLEFRRVVMELLGTEGDDGCSSDFDTLNRLQRLVSGQREMVQLSRKLGDVTAASSRPCSAHTLHSRSSSGRSLSPHRSVSAPYPLLDHRLPMLESPLADLNADLRALTEHAHNHRPIVRVLHSSPSRSSASDTPGKPSPSPSSNAPQSQSGSPQTKSSSSSVNGCVGKSCSLVKGHFPSCPAKSYSPTRQSPRRSPTSPRPTSANGRATPTQDSPLLYSRRSKTLTENTAISGRQSPSSIRQLTPPTRQSPSPPNRYSQSPSSPPNRLPQSPSPILTRPGSATRRLSFGRTNSVSFLDQEGEGSSDEDQDDDDP